MKSGRDMVLTDLARSLIPQIDETITQAQRLLGEPDFDPAKLTQRFVIGTADSVVMTLGPPLAEVLEAEAPGASAQFLDPHEETLQDVLLGTVDLVIAPPSPGRPNAERAARRAIRRRVRLRSAQGTSIGGIGHTSWVLAQRPGTGAMLNP